jgi:Zn-dependent M28 family amino/carboxypeptidase
VLGAHDDHLGRGTTDGLLAGKDQAGQIHHGADDNPSGTAAVLAIAEALSTQARKRNLLVAFWSGEEPGLIGSNAFVTSPPVPTGDMAACLNLDWLGRAGVDEWRRRETLEVLHHVYGEPRAVERALYQDAARYDAFALSLAQPILISQGRLDASVDPVAVEAWARTRATVTLRLLDDDHRLTASIETIWRRRRCV